MNQFWLNYIMIAVLIISVVTAGVMLYINNCSSKKDDKENGDSNELEKFRNQLEGYEIPAELTEILLGLYERIFALEQSKIGQAEKFLALFNSIEKSIKDGQDAARLSELKVNAILENVIDRQKKIIAAEEYKQINELIKRIKDKMKKPLRQSEDIDEFLKGLMSKD